MIKRVKNWWLKVRVLYLVFKQYWNADEMLAYRDGQMYASVEKRMSNYLSALIVHACPTVLQDFKETFRQLEEDGVVESEFPIHWRPESKDVEIGILGKCIEELYLYLYGGRDYKVTPLFLAGYHQGLTDGAKYLDKVIPFADADDKTVEAVYSEPYETPARQKPQYFEFVNPFENVEPTNIIKDISTNE